MGGHLMNVQLSKETLEDLQTYRAARQAYLALEVDDPHTEVLKDAFQQAAMDLAYMLNIDVPEALQASG